MPDNTDNTDNTEGEPMATATKTPATMDALDDAQQNLQNAEMALRIAEQARTDVMRALVTAGVRQTEIAARAGISRARVGQLVGPRSAAS